MSEESYYQRCNKMTVSRREIVQADEVGYYHCVARCVRRAFLCGVDEYSGCSYEHRREWIRQRLCFLMEVFAIELVSYAVMSNHLHSLIRIRPDLTLRWSDKEVATRWRALFPLRWHKGKVATPNAVEIRAITAQPELVSEYRKRLCSVSWFNRCLNERIARMANAEDECGGRFWEGRFKCQRVVDTGAILTCSAYIDLNPIRAGLAKTPERSDYTSIQDRIRRHVGRMQSCSFLPPLLSVEEVSDGYLSIEDYLTLVDTTGRMIVRGKCVIPENLTPILSRIGVNPDQLLNTTVNYRKLFRRIVGPVDSLRRAAKEIGKCWLHGVRNAYAVFG